MTDRPSVTVPERMFAHLPVAPAHLMRPGKLLFMTEATAEDITEAEWARLLSSDGVDNELVRAAYAEPRLRQLFPWGGMWELHFSRCTEHPYTWDVPSIAPRKGGGFRVEGPSRSEVVGSANTAAEAVAMVARRPPPGCGPELIGNRHDLATHQGQN